MSCIHCSTLFSLLFVVFTAIHCYHYYLLFSLLFGHPSDAEEAMVWPNLGDKKDEVAASNFGSYVDGQYTRHPWCWSEKSAGLRTFPWHPTWEIHKAAYGKLNSRRCERRKCSLCDAVSSKKNEAVTLPLAVYCCGQSVKINKILVYSCMKSSQLQVAMTSHLL